MLSGNEERSKSSRFRIVIAACWLLAGPAAWGQEKENLTEARFSRLEERLEHLEKVVRNQALLETAAQLTQLQEDVRRLGGALEEQKHLLQNLDQSHKDLYTDLDNRLQELSENDAISRQFGLTDKSPAEPRDDVTLGLTDAAAGERADYIRDEAPTNETLGTAAESRPPEARGSLPADGTATGTGLTEDELAESETIETDGALTVPSATATAEPDAAPTVPSAAATTEPTAAPTVPSAAATAEPTAAPTVPGAAATAETDAAPTVPSAAATTEPAAAPTVPSAAATAEPTAAPTGPGAAATAEPDAAPTVPSATATTEPTAAPTVPSAAATTEPTAAPIGPGAAATTEPDAAPTGPGAAATAEPDAAPTAPDIVATAEPEIDRLTMRVEYEKAFRLLKNGHYDRAIDALRQYLEKYPDSPHWINARYWLAEAFFVSGRYSLAASEYEGFITDHADSPKYPQSLLKLGYSYDELGQSKKARHMLGQVISRFPDSAVALLARKRLEQMRR